MVGFKRPWRGVGRAFVAVIAAVASLGGVSAQSVTSCHRDAGRSGLYVAPALTWAKAATVRLDAGFHAKIDGAVYAQPLYWVPAQGAAGRVIVATEANKVYALDATTGAQIWVTSLGAPVPLSALPCGNIDPMGVTGTPAIDPATGLLLVEAFVQTAKGPRHMVFGLSLATGKPASGWPVDVANGLAALHRGFSDAAQGQRSALTLVDGKLYVPYAGHYGDCGAYHGMVVGFDLAKPAVFGAWSTEAEAGGSWGLSGVAFDGASMFVTTGNAFGAEPTWGGSEAVIRLPPALGAITRIADYFTPRNWRALDQGDVDLGGTSAIPILTPSARVLALGKDGNAYLLNRADLGGIGGQVAMTRVSTEEIITAMATYPVADAAMVAFEGQGAGCPHGPGNLVMLRVSASAIAAAWCAAFDGAGAPIVTTTDGKSDPVVWVAGAGGDGRLHGFRGTDGASLASVAGPGVAIQRRQTLLYADGRFYLAANGAVAAFGF